MTLRGVVLGASVGVAVLGAVVAAAGIRGAIGPAAGGAALAVLLAGERWRYHHRHRGAARGGFRKTGERFRDPASGDLVAVEFDPGSGARRYTVIDEPRPE